MRTAKSAGRTIAWLLLVQMVTSAVISDLLARPVFAAPGFLENAAAHSQQVAIVVLLGLVSGALPVGVASVALPVFRPYSEALAYGLLALAAAGFAVVVVEHIHLMSMLSLSQAYAKADAADARLFQTLRGVVASSRNWAHYTALLITASFAFTLYCTLYRFKLAPRALAAFGMLAALSQLTAVAMPLFGHRVFFPMIYPLGVSYLALVLWLLGKGFAERPPFAPAARLPQEGPTSPTGAG